MKRLKEFVPLPIAYSAELPEDVAGRASYRGDLAIVLKYALEGNKLETIRGVCDCVVPKGTERIKLAAAIESLPE